MSKEAFPIFFRSEFKMVIEKHKELRPLNAFCDSCFDELMKDGTS